MQEGSLSISSYNFQINGNQGNKISTYSVDKKVNKTFTNLIVSTSDPHMKSYIMTTYVSRLNPIYLIYL